MARRGSITKRQRGTTMVASEAAYEVVDQALLDLWKVVDDLWQIRAPQPHFYRVTIFGSSRVRRGSPLYKKVRRLAAELSAMGCDIVTGAGPGLMEAANEGVRLGDPQRRVRSYGLAIQLPHEQEPNPFVERAFMHRTFFTRLHHFVLLSSAFVVVPGGIGTTLETMLIWQLLQVRHAYDTPLVLVGDMWQELVRWARRHMTSHEQHLASERELAIPTCVRTIEEAIEAIRRHHLKFLQQHSSPR
ncbi:MAG: LOG family protein [Candidatus Acidiferrales bacterium]